MHIVRDTILAVCPKLIVALGNIALRVVFASARLDQSSKLPTLDRLNSIGLNRNHSLWWPEQMLPDESFIDEWNESCPGKLPAILWLTHPSAQNMSPYARTDTLFHSRMTDARAALRSAVRDVLDYTVPETRPQIPRNGIYALPEWRELIAPRFEVLDNLWRGKGI